MNQIDANGDGVLTMDEWETVLTPKISAEQDFIKIMKGITIKDPLVLEEQILDLVYKNKRLQTEVKQMKITYDKVHFMQKAKMKGEHKILTDKIKELETDLTE